MTADAELAFFAPMKPPDHPTPSGDRTLARALTAAAEGLKLDGLDEEGLDLAGLDLAGIDAGRALAPRLMSRLITRDGRGDRDAQQTIETAARAEIDRLAAGPRPAAWLTYHNYYKAPDLLGPALADAWDVPYAIVEASRAPKRRDGPWSAFAAAADAASDRADVIFYMTDRDRPALEAARPQGQALVRLRPFLAIETLAPPPPSPPAETGAPLTLLAVGMLRRGDKHASYAALAAALAHVRSNWRLDIVGDGPAEAEIRALFAPFAGRARFLGRLRPDAVAAEMARADLFVWPGVNEAFGLVYLEAQAAGTPVLSEDRAGVRDVVRNGGVRAPAQHPTAFAAAIDALAADPARRAALGAAGRAQIAADHLLPAARRTLRAGLQAALATRRARRAAAQQKTEAGAG